jgi:hypothetical protein
MSRWRMPLAWAWARAWATCRNTLTMSSDFEDLPADDQLRQGAPRRQLHHQVEDAPVHAETAQLNDVFVGQPRQQVGLVFEADTGFDVRLGPEPFGQT